MPTANSFLESRIVLVSVKGRELGETEAWARSNRRGCSLHLWWETIIKLEIRTRIFSLGFNFVTSDRNIWQAKQFCAFLIWTLRLCVDFKNYSKKIVSTKRLRITVSRDGGRALDSTVTNLTITHHKTILWSSIKRTDWLCSFAWVICNYIWRVIALWWLYFYDQNSKGTAAHCYQTLRSKKVWENSKSNSLFFNHFREGEGLLGITPRHFGSVWFAVGCTSYFRNITFLET